MNLYQRINEVRKSIDYIKKDKSVSTGGSSYQAVTHDQVTAMVRDHMVKHGIISYPVFVEGVSIPKEENAKQFRYEAVYDFFFVNMDDPSDKICLRIQAHAMDNSDKATGKALSYAKKYAVLKLFEIETGEDDESRYSEFDLDSWLDEIKHVTNLDQLKSVYQKASEAAMNAKDTMAKKAINLQTKKMKEVLV